MQAQNSMMQAKPGRVARPHRDTNPIVLMCLVVGFIALLWGTITLTSRLENDRPAKAHTSLKSLPPIFVHQ